MNVSPNNLYTGKCTDEQYEKINTNKSQTTGYLKSRKNKRAERES